MEKSNPVITAESARRLCFLVEGYVKYGTRYAKKKRQCKKNRKRYPFQPKPTYTLSPQHFLFLTAPSHKEEVLDYVRYMVGLPEGSWSSRMHGQPMYD